MVSCVTIQNIDILRLNINMIEEIIMHKTVIAFWMFFWQTHIFIHIKGHHMFKTHFSRLI